MDTKDFTTALVGALLGLLPTLVSALIEWREKRSKNAKREEAIDFAQRQVTFLSDWLQARRQSEPGRNISGIRKSVAAELDEIKKSVDQAIAIAPVYPGQKGITLVSQVSYMLLRRIIGFFGIVFPFLLAGGGLLIFNTGIQDSISSYYYTGMRGVYIFSLFAIGICLLLYKGYTRLDWISSTVVGIFAIGMAIFPTSSNAPTTNSARLLNMIHSISTLLFLLISSFMFLFLFTKTGLLPYVQKMKRNLVYRVCGFTLLGLVLLITIYGLVVTVFHLESLHLIFWVESLAFITFGVAWLTKGQWILPDVASPKEE